MDLALKAVHLLTSIGWGAQGWRAASEGGLTCLLAHAHPEITVRHTQTWHLTLCKLPQSIAQPTGCCMLPPAKTS